MTTRNLLRVPGWTRRPAGPPRCRPVLVVLEDRSVPAAVAGGDFNGDGFADLAVGLPGETVGDWSGAGAVRIWYGSASGLTTAGGQLWSQDSPGIEEVAELDDQFGSAVAAGDFNGDGRDDLVIGVPGEDLGDTYTCGLVHVLYGSAAGLTADRSQVWHQNSSGIVHSNSPEDWFGTAVAAGDFNGDGRDDLAVGMPGNRAGYGAIIVIYGSSAGLTSSGNRAFESEEPGVEGTGQWGEHYGMALAAGDFDADGRDDLAVGIPDKDAPGATDAGAVNVLYGSGSGLAAWRDVLLWQGSGGLPDAAEAGDRFGASLAAGDFDGDGRDELAVGVAREDTLATDAGAVNVLRGSSTGLTATGSQVWTQDAAGAEAGDRFGEALAAADFNGDGRADLAIASPREDTLVTDAGTVLVLYGAAGSGLTAAGSQLWSQDSPDVLGAEAAGDRFGSALAGADFNGDGAADVAADVPGEGGGVGAVGVLYGSKAGVTATGNQLLTWGRPPAAPETLVAAGSAWKYLDNGSDQGTAWRDPGFDDSGWATGSAQLGYGDGDEATVVGYGPSSSRKYVTTYFRNTFSVADPARYDGLSLRLLRDDGAVVYLNGVEVFRSNMPSGSISYTTLASSAVSGTGETTFYEVVIPAALLVSGTNTLAVEIHQATADSSDLSFDLELLGQPAA